MVTRGIRIVRDLNTVGVQPTDIHSEISPRLDAGLTLSRGLEAGISGFYVPGIPGFNSNVCMYVSLADYYISLIVGFRNFTSKIEEGVMSRIT